MKVDREFSFEDLPQRVRESLTEMVQKHVDQLVRDYNETLMAEGLIIGFDSCNILTKKISNAAKVTVKISAKCDSDILSAYHVYPQDMHQNRIQDFDILPQAGDTALYEKRKAAAKAVEEGQV